MKQSVVRLSAIQKKARAIQKEKSIKWHHALDEAAISFGYVNFQNYRNLATTNRSPRTLSLKEAHELLAKPRAEVISKKLHAVNLQIQSSKFSMQNLLAMLKQGTRSKKAKRTLCESSGLNEFIRLHLLKDFLEDDAEMNAHEPYHVLNEIVLKNLRYGLIGNTMNILGDFDLKLEFAFEYNPDSTDELFNPREMIGDFDLTIDQNNLIEFEDILMGYNL